MLLQLEKCKKYVYADVMVVCEDAEIEKKVRQGLDILRNPNLIIEVLSESTAFYDKNEKRCCYFQLESLQQYVLVDSEKLEIISYIRTKEDEWEVKTFTDLSEFVRILDFHIDSENIYAQIVF